MQQQKCHYYKAFSKNMWLLLQLQLSSFSGSHLAKLSVALFKALPFSTFILPPSLHTYLDRVDSDRDWHQT